MIKVNSVVKTFDGFTALNGLSMTAERGSIYGLVGPNGAGKSTILRHIMGVYRPDSGSILVHGEPVYENPAVKAKIAAIPDDLYYFNSASTRDMMRFCRGMYPSFDVKRYEALKEAFPEVDERLPIRRLSKGMQKQSAFRLALCCNPEVLVLDEPVDGLDPVMRRQVWTLLMGDVAQRGTTVLVSSHNLRELEDVCDHVGILSHGKVLLERSLTDLQDNVVKLQIAFAGGELPQLPKDMNMLNTYFDRYRSTAPQKRLMDMAAELPDMLAPGVFLAAFFAILCAMAVFGYLYNHRSACWTHALPLRREALFTTQYLAGLSMMLLPLLAAAVLTAVVEVSFLPMESWGAALSALGVWLLVQSGICLFFFSFAAFCAMFTGHILALPAFYFIFNALAEVLWFLVSALMTEFYYGYVGTPGMEAVVEYLTPTHALAHAAWWYRDTPAESAHLSSPGTVAVYAAVGVLLALASLWVYRRRHVETAGDVVAVAVVRPLFKYGVAFCAGLSFGMFTAAFFGWSDLPALIPCILVWTVVGYFVAEMLLKKSFRVLKAWKGAAVMAVVLLVLCLACLSDAFGVVNRVPKAGQVESIWVSIDMGTPYDDGQRLDATITDPAQIEKILALHQAIVDHRDAEEDSGQTTYTYIALSYTLTGGGRLERGYRSVPVALLNSLDTPGTVAYALRQIQEDRGLVALAYGFGEFMENARLTSAYLDGLYYDGEYDSSYLYLDDYRQELWDAVQADFAEGTIGVRYFYDVSQDRLKNTYVTDLIFEAAVNSSEAKDAAANGEVYYETRPSNRTLRITLTPNARHTLAVLMEAGIWDQGDSLNKTGVGDQGDSLEPDAALAGSKVVF